MKKAKIQARTKIAIGDLLLSLGHNRTDIIPLKKKKAKIQTGLILTLISF